MAETATDPAAIGPRQRTLVLAATILASSMGFIDGNVVTVALPTIQESFAAEFGAMQWVINGYALMLGALIVVTGGLGDLYGRRRMFLLGIVIFTLASIACALSTSVGFLVGARIVQGIGAALLIPQSLAIISVTFPRESRGRAIGTWAAASAAMTALGPPLGGFLIDWFGWQVVFWINVPLAVIAVLLTVRAVPESRNPDAKRSIDWAGAVLAMVGFGALAYGLAELSNGADSDAGIAWATIAAGIVALALFIWTEFRVDNPLVPPILFRSKTFSGANLLTLFLYGTLAAVLFLLPYELGVRRLMSAGEIGLALMPVGIIIAVFSRLMGGLSDRTGPRLFLLAGTALVALGCALFAIDLANFWIGIMVPLLLLAFGMALVVSPLTTAVMNSVSDGRSGAASGVNNAAARIGGLLAVAAFGAVASMIFLANAPEGAERFGILPDAADAARPAMEAAFDSAYSAAMWLAALWAALATIATALLIRNDSASGKPAPG